MLPYTKLTPDYTEIIDDQGCISDSYDHRFYVMLLAQIKTAYIYADTIRV